MPARISLHAPRHGPTCKCVLCELARGCCGDARRPRLMFVVRARRRAPAATLPAAQPVRLIRSQST
eukprot:2781730-Alexandrium_andersonii.AAC.1